jgi:hypothetical protein
MDPVNIWFYRNKIKKDFLGKEKIIPGLPIMEFLIAADIAKGDYASFTAHQARDLMNQANLQRAERTLYATVRHCRAQGYIQSVTAGRRWFEPYRYFFTPKGALLLVKFKQKLTYN